jgi:hypothetical protein
MKSRNSAKIISLFLSSICATAAQAFEFSPTLEIHGFGTAGASMTNATEVDVINPITRLKTGGIPEIAGIGNKPTFTEDTLGGLRFIAGVNDTISFTAEFLSEGSTGYDVTTDWLYAQWQATDQWDIKVGRIRIPLFMLSQYLKVGYTYPWSRPPIEVYNFVSISDFTGILIRNVQPLVKGWASEFTAGFGNTRDFDNVFSHATFEFHNATTLEWILSNEYIRLRAGYMVGALDIIYPPAFVQAQQLLENPCGFFDSALAPEIITVAQIPGAPGQCHISAVAGLPAIPARFSTVRPDGQTAKLLATENATSQFLSFGYDFNWNHIISLAEWKTRHNDDKIAPSPEGWYVLLGYNWDDITFHATYASSSTNNDSGRIITNSIAGTYINPFSIVNPPPLPMAETMETSINRVFATASAGQTSIDLGIRYDILPGTALKFDYRYVTVQKGAGFFAAPQGFASPGKRISWVTAVINVVF